MSAKREKILVVEDTSGVREFIKYYFEDTGYVVLTATSAEDVLPIIKNDNPEILILNINLPGVSGWDLLKKVRELDMAIKVIMISGSGEDLKNDPRFEGLDVFDFVLKPMGFYGLELAVIKAIKMPKQERRHNGAL